MTDPQANDQRNTAAFPSHGPLIPGDFPGLTKRELFAAMAMQGILATETAEDDFSAKDVSRRAVAFADALLTALEQAQKP